MNNLKIALLFLLFNLNLLYAQTTRVTGIVIAADDGEPVIGASVFVKGTQTGTVTDLNGDFVLDVPENTVTLTFSYVGMVTQDLKVESVMKVIMQPDTKNLNEVVVQAGIIQRDRVSFTGSYSTFKGEELKIAGNQNVIQSLKSLDPSFIVLENNLFGSDPNTLASIEVRGQTSVIIGEIQDEGETLNEENLPLFILNGFETTLKRVNDLDMNRIESITILKDAGSTAIYGAKAANGVVVIETIKPKAGQIKINFNNDSNVSWADLGSYNMMNAAEKLQYELLAGKYDYPNSTNTEMTQEWDLLRKQVYTEYLGRVEQGVNTYWLKEPVRTAFTTRNSLVITGGSDELMFTAGAAYKSQKGVMKGSDRNTWEGSLDLTYRKGNVNITNSLTVSGTDLQNSPYGTFSNWVNANPYFTMRNANGEVEKYLERAVFQSTLSGATETSSLIKEDTYNPLYNALLSSYSKGSNFDLVNNLQLVWYILPELRFSGAVSLKKDIEETTNFIDPRDTRYESRSATESGEYNNINYSRWEFETNASLNYLKVLNKVHNFTVVARGELGERRLTGKGFEAVGFPPSGNGIPSYADSYKKNSRPFYTSDRYRKVNLLGVFNYSYDYRYLFDATYRVDGSTTFGSNEKFKNFWSLGLGWNVYREAFMEEVDWLDLLKIRGTYGTTGNQNVGNMYSSSIYQYYTGNTLFGQGGYLSIYGNPNLQWQQTTKAGAGVDLEVLNRRLTFRFDLFKGKTSNLAVEQVQPPSTGISKFPTNHGHLDNKGLEFMVGFSPVYNLKEQIIWNIRVSGLKNDSKYGGLGSVVDELNLVSDYNSTRSLHMYKDGYSPKDLWAVQSLGIDPASGNEVYLKKNGERTFEYDPDDRVKVGSTQPTMTGVVATSFTYKRLMVSAIMRYSFGSDQFNFALFDKVENISRSNISYNQDKRALYDRWQKPGDIAQFRRINDLTHVTNVSSRFVQKNNYFTGESIYVSWDLSGYNWVKTIRVDKLRITATMNDIFRVSTIKAERGTLYPYAKVISFGLSASI